jgi:hypothetical protein
MVVNSNPAQRRRSSRTSRVKVVTPSASATTESTTPTALGRMVTTPSTTPSPEAASGHSRAPRKPK